MNPFITNQIKLVFVTGNPKKIDDVYAALIASGAQNKIALSTLNLPGVVEIQPDDTLKFKPRTEQQAAVSLAKAKSALEIFFSERGEKVVTDKMLSDLNAGRLQLVVEDTGFYFGMFGGLPGVNIKSYTEKYGHDKYPTALLALAESAVTRGDTGCSYVSSFTAVRYANGKPEFTTYAKEIHGNITNQPSGKGLIDPFFIPKGETLNVAGLREQGANLDNAHPRFGAIKQLLESVP